MTFLIIIFSSLIIYFKISPQWSILLGLSISITLPSSSFVLKYGKSWSTTLLQLSIVLLGAGLNFQSVIKEGSFGLIVTSLSIISVFIFGHLLNRFFNIQKTLSLLITTGTSICGGSAISAISPIVNASTLTMATALSIVFILNAISVFIFPPIGHLLNLTELQFGTWAALAIHDTSSVIAASQIYGEQALKVGTTLKLTRALWIIPLSLILAALNKAHFKLSFPWFIIGFLLTSLFFTFSSNLNFLIPYFTSFSKIGFSLTLFLIGLSLNLKQVKEIGFKPIFYAFILWFISAVGSLIFVLY